MSEVMNPVACSACASTDSPHGYVRGMCRRCYQRWRKHGTTALPSPADRFWAKVDRSGECWIWKGYLNPGGYGQFGDGSRLHLAHRWAYSQTRGAIPVGLTLDHLCRTTACVRPDHLEPVSVAENIRRTTGLKVEHYARGSRSHCRYGHEMSVENSYPRPGRVNSYACRRCMANYQQAYVERKKARG